VTFTKSGVLQRLQYEIGKVKWMDDTAKAIKTACDNRKIRFSADNYHYGLLLAASRELPYLQYPLAKMAAKKKSLSPKMVEKLTNYKFNKKVGVMSFLAQAEKMIAKLKAPVAKFPLTAWEKQQFHVLVKGSVTATELRDFTTVSRVKLTDMCMFMNDINLDTALEILITKKEPRRFWGVADGTDPATVLNEQGQFLLEKFNNRDSWMPLFSDAEYTEASGGTNITFTKWTDIIPGPLLEMPLKGTLFETGKIAVTPELTKQVTEAYAAAQAYAKAKGGEIVSAVVRSGASSGRPVKGTPEDFAASVGMSVNDVPTADKLGKDTPGKVTDPKASGNAFLAWYRGVAAEEELKKAGFTLPTSRAPEIGGPVGDENPDAAMDAQQYVQIGFEVQVDGQRIEHSREDIERTFKAGGGKGGQLILHMYDAVA
jgi:hypothetical protein